jgi:hypothetical protein
MINKVWVSVAARRKATEEAQAAVSTSGYTNHFASEGAALINADASSSSGSGFGGAAQ